MPRLPMQSGGHATARPEIARAWQRAALAGLEPGMPVREIALEDVDRDSRLMAAAAPVLDRMMTELADTHFSVLLADAEARIVDRRPGQSGLDRALDRACAVPGARYLEETTGTNSLATAFELRQPISVTGDEHYLEELKHFCCHGAPILHPVTKRLEGVLDISGPVVEATPLLGPFVMRAVRDIEQLLLAGSRRAQQRLLGEFQAHTRRKGHAILALGEGIALGNPAAMELLTSSDHGTLRVVAQGITGTRSVQRSVVLASGADVMVRARPVAGCPGGVLFDVVEMSVRRPDPRPSTRAGVILVVGEPGTGRTTEARALAGAEAAIFVGDVAAAKTELDNGRSLLIDDVHLLTTQNAARLAAMLRTYQGRVVLASSPVAELDSEHAALVALAVERVELPPLRSCRDQFAHRAAELLRRNYPENNVRLTGSALAALAAHNWPGNLRELEHVLSQAIQHRSCGDITERDLPSAYRNLPTRTLSPIEAAERETILAQLRTADGNKVAAAAALGIGRTTLYARLHRYGISA
ncbi:transcriptional activator of acetoin/glycerol metabolism [Mycobacteroides abscessus subsp. abscessus]|nr:transcriptional activator of acetoin/glycerol metabolism [Mycobacteroides abscessus subsp. abscessus]